jgi:predicted transcriptional regulator
LDNSFHADRSTGGLLRAVTAFQIVSNYISKKKKKKKKKKQEKTIEQKKKSIKEHNTDTNTKKTNRPTRCRQQFHRVQR